MIKIRYGEYDCLHFKQEIAEADRDIQDHERIGVISRETGSEHYILRIQQAVRSGLISGDQVKIQCLDRQIDLDIKGDFIQPWPDDLFEAAFYLRFNPYPEVNDSE
jgi:hypothetical protein